MSIVLTLILIVAVIVAGLVWFAANTARKVEAAVPPCGQFIEIDGQRLHYTDTKGTGPAIVMIHALGGTLRNYTYALVDKLSGEFPGIARGRLAHVAQDHRLDAGDPDVDPARAEAVEDRVRTGRGAGGLPAAGRRAAWAAAEEFLQHLVRSRRR